MSYDLFSQPGDTAPTRETIERLFFGLMLPEPQGEDAVRILNQARETEGIQGPPIRKDRLHITLIHVGDYANALPGSVVPPLRDAAEAMAPAAFDVVLDRVSGFSGAPGRHPLVLLGDDGVAALKAFRADLLKAVIRQGVKPLSRQEFTPHVTLSYGDRRVPERPIRPISWRPEEFVLIHSEVGRSIYHTLGRWPLR
jgi:2'-5' RNA ligase